MAIRTRRKEVADILNLVAKGSFYKNMIHKGKEITMKGASLVVYVNEDGEVVGAKNVDKETGNALNTDPEYGPEEQKMNKKFVGGNFKTKLWYPNACCWKLIGGKWVCVSCS
jgi:hypothetical protein